MSTKSKSQVAATGSPKVPTGPLAMRPNCWMVGHRNPESLLQCNTYIRTFDAKGSPMHVCIDPGSQFDFSVIENNVTQLIGGLDAIHSFTVNHQDPDVAGNSPYLCDANPKVDMLVTEEVWRLLQHMLLKPGRVRLVSQARSRMTAVGAEHPLELVPTPFCHFRGAMAFYDPEIRTLFSGDLFGGLNRVGAVHLLAEERDWAGIAQFHQIYMPSREALRYSVQQILNLRPAVEVIAPQHGHVITGALVPLFLERMHELLVGLDLLASELDDTNLDDYREVLAELIARAELTLGPDEVFDRLKSNEAKDEFERYVQFQDRSIRLEREGFTAIVKAFARLAKGEPLDFANALRSVVLASCLDRQLPIPPVGTGLEEGVGSGLSTPAPEGYAWRAGDPDEGRRRPR